MTGCAIVKKDTELLLKWIKPTLLLTVLSLAACSSKPLSEQQRYRQYQDSFTYTSYSALSKKVLRPILKTATKQHSAAEAKTSAVNPQYAHSFLSLMHTLSQNQTLALAEADLALESASKRSDVDPVATMLSYKASGYAFHGKGLHGLGYQADSRSDALLSHADYANAVQSADANVRLLLGVVAVLNDEPEQAEVMFAAMAERINTPWLPRVMRIATLSMNHPITAAPQIVELLNQPYISDSERRYLTQLQTLNLSEQLTDEQRQRSINQLVKQWTLAGFAELLSLSGDALSEVSEQVAESYLRLLSRN